MARRLREPDGSRGQGQSVPESKSVVEPWLIVLMALIGASIVLGVMIFARAQRKQKMADHRFELVRELAESVGAEYFKAMPSQDEKFRDANPPGENPEFVKKAENDLQKLADENNEIVARADVCRRVGYEDRLIASSGAAFACNPGRWQKKPGTDCYYAKGSAVVGGQSYDFVIYKHQILAKGANRELGSVYMFAYAWE